MIKVQVRPNEPLEAALRRFKRQCNYAGIFRLAKKHSFHEKRSDKRRREERERIRNIQRAMRKQTRSVRRTKRRKSKVKAPSVDDAETQDDQQAGGSVESGSSSTPRMGRASITEVVTARAGSEAASES